MKVDYRWVFDINQKWILRYLIGFSKGFSNLKTNPISGKMEVTSKSAEAIKNIAIHSYKNINYS